MPIVGSHRPVGRVILSVDVVNAKVDGRDVSGTGIGAYEAAMSLDAPKGGGFLAGAQELRRLVRAMIIPTYKRAPSKALELCLAEGVLQPLLSVGRRKVAGCHLDVHLRPDDEVHVYCGLTRLVVVRLKADGGVDVKADKSYVSQDCAQEFFGSLELDEIDASEFERRLIAYLDGVKVACRWVQGEGSVQTAWSLMRDPWIPFDREAVLGYRSNGERDRGQYFERVREGRDHVEAVRTSRRWAELPGRGGEVDQLAIDPDGSLVVMELKDASSRGWRSRSRSRSRTS